jgi:hypothetical protein
MAEIQLAGMVEFRSCGRGVTVTFWSSVFATVTNPVMAPSERMLVEFRYSFT